MAEKPSLKKKLLPLLLTAFVILADQLTKALVVKYIPLYSLFNENSIIPLLGDFVRLIHVRNKAVAFSIGSSLPLETRRILFSFIPLAIIAFVFVLYFRHNEFTGLQRWAICGIIGGLAQGAYLDQTFAVLYLTVVQMSKTILTMLGILGLAKIMTYSGMISSGVSSAAGGSFLSAGDSTR